MDLDDDHPRFQSNKTARNTTDEGAASDSGGEDRTHKKRRTICKRKLKNDPPSIQKQNVGFKCSPHLLFDLFKKLDVDQIKWVEEIGFGILLSMPRCVLPKDLTVWLVKQFSWEKKALIVRGRTVAIRPLIKKLLGIPDGTLPVPLPRSKRGKTKCTNPNDDEKEMKGEKAPRGLSYKTSFESLIDSHDPVEFKRSFMLYVLCIYFAPSSGLFLNLSYSPIVSNVEFIKDMNWCDHVADVLIEGIRDFRESKAAHVNVHGCVHVLLLIYIDMVKSPILIVPPGIPRANHVTSQLLDLLDMSDMKFRTCDGREYGKLELDELTYGEDIHPENNPRPASLVHENQGIPGFRSSVHVRKVFSEGIQLIDTQYSESRDKVYAECFKTFSEKMIKIEAERSSSVVSLYEKVAILQEEAASLTETSGTVPTKTPSIPPSPCGRCSTGAESSNGTMKSRSTALPVSSPTCTTPTKESGLEFHGIETSKLSRVPVDLPIQVESEIYPQKNDLVSQKVHKSQASPHTADKEQHRFSDSVDGIEKSYDLQQNCVNLSTLIVSRAGSDNINRDGLSRRSGILFHEGTVHSTEFTDTNDSDPDDPWLINQKVASFGKESSSQALNETDTALLSPLKSCHQQKSCTVDFTSAVITPSINGSRIDLTEACTSTVDIDSKIDDQVSQAETMENTAAVVQTEPDAGLSTSITEIHVKDGNPEMVYSAHPTGQSCNLSLSFPQEQVGAVNVKAYIPHSPVPVDCLSGSNVQGYGPANADGEVFAVERSVNTAVRIRNKRFGKTESLIDGIAELKKNSYKISSGANQTYTDFVEKSIFWGTERKGVHDAARNCGGKTIIKINGVHLSEEEFVHTLLPTGQVDTNFMWICSVAIMLEWQSKSRTIVNQTIIRELMKSKDVCDHEKVASNLKLLPLEQIDQLYLPVPNNGHWILILLTLSRRVAEIYDPLTPYKKGDDPHGDLWKTIGYNMQIAYGVASTKPLPIHDDFEKHRAPIQTNSNLHDSGLEVIRILGCHNGKDHIGYGKKNMASYRKEVAHTLVYHRYNDLSPGKQSQSEGEDQ